MITQEKMYDVFYNNQDYVNFVNSVHFKKVRTNERVFSSMQSNSLYAQYLKSRNKSLNKKDIINHLNLFNNKFWLKKEPLGFILFLRAIKQKQITPDDVYYYFTEDAIASNLFSYIALISIKTRYSDKTLEYIANYIYDSPITAINLLIKKKLIK